MPRSGEDARRRLQGAALELWSERGYDQTTTAEIAARAGVTPRTFYRHFPDKREVLFDSAEALRELLVNELAATPRGLTPMKALQQAFMNVETLFEQNWPYSGTRQKVISETPALRERELAKTATLTEALAEALMTRGVEPRRSRLTAQMAMAAFGFAFATWSESPQKGLGACIALTFAELSGLASVE